MAHIFSNPNVLGMLSCYGCSSFLVQGTYVLGADCAPVFSTPSPSQKINADGKSGNDTVTAIPTNAKLGDLQKDVHPADAQLFPLNFGDMMKGLRNIDMKELQDWFDIGQGLVNVVQTNNIAASAKNSTMTSRVKLEMEEERQKADKGLFNMFVSKAAGFANWILTPEMVEGTGAFDRLNNSKIL
ncbi:hypothetical protein BC939DRAFT_455735 [Gamsiella multidivaricata]|uniref:uncharacterized protein n=1 Tax=Gamsiella multidivaricata TaxID=101098 RepID=UPI00222093EB|nr:uncharacterized protein BC939DRAFT_455735 [Gamsiella multidivaricata]KAI7821332.1 hypothetical protein BC939DRAFT_455735 [Gamsiella multidivaricata]